MRDLYIHDEYFNALRGRGLLSDIERMAHSRRDLIAVDTLPTDTGWKVEVRTASGSYRLLRNQDKLHFAVEREGAVVKGKDYPCREDGLVEASIDLLAALVRGAPRK